MQLITPVEPSKSPITITHKSKILLLGSCFAQNIGNRLTGCKFNACINPFGIIYNPLSISTALHRICSGEEFDEQSPLFFEHNGRWHSALHHGDFSRDSAAELAAATNSTLRHAHETIKEADVVIITFGTAYAYERTCDNLVVGNCHKLPASSFNRRLLSIEEITAAVGRNIEEIAATNPKVRFLFTVSPIRHMRDGAHGNQISKSTLLLAINELERRYPQHTTYFPAYEIVLDELRDYRFYAEDMTHPSPTAVEYIWEKFSEYIISPESRKLNADIEEIARALAHRPFDEKSNAYANFLARTGEKIAALTEKHPYLDFEKEKVKCNIQLKK